MNTEKYIISHEAQAIRTFYDRAYSKYGSKKMPEAQTDGNVCDNKNTRKPIRLSSLGNFLSCKQNKKIIKTIAIATMLPVFCIGTITTVYGRSPYSLSVDGNTVCCVANRSDAEKVLADIQKEYSVKDSDVKAFDADGRIGIKRLSLLDPNDNKMKPDTATGQLSSVIKEKREKSELNIRTTSVKKEERKYVPEPTYKQDEKMLAGQEKVISEGKDGKQVVSVLYTSVNGDVTEKQDLGNKITDNGTPSVIVKGTLGLPEGADWKKFDGDPVANDGLVISETAKTYDGKVRYVRGKDSLVTGLDCVGFVRAIYRLYGINLSDHLRREGRGVSYSNIKPGDVICYSSHYGIYIGNGMQVDARSGGGVAIRTVASTGQKIIGVRRIIN